jgi:hypothetical protein
MQRCLAAVTSLFRFEDRRFSNDLFLYRLVTLNDVCPSNKAV